MQEKEAPVSGVFKPAACGALAEGHLPSRLGDELAKGFDCGG